MTERGGRQSRQVWEAVTTCIAIIHCAQLAPYMEHFSCDDTPDCVMAEAMSDTNDSVSSYVNHS